MLVRNAIMVQLTQQLCSWIILVFSHQSIRSNNKLTNTIEVDAVITESDSIQTTLPELISAVWCACSCIVYLDFVCVLVIELLSSLFYYAHRLVLLCQYNALCFKVLLCWHNLPGLTKICEYATRTSTHKHTSLCNTYTDAWLLVHKII